MTETLFPPDLVDFLLFDWLNLEQLLQRPQFADHDRESVTALLDLADRMAREEFLPHYKTADQVEPRLTPEGDVQVLPQAGVALSAYADAGFMAAPFAAEHGGLGLPELVHMAATGSFFAANVASASYAMLTVGNARLMVHNASPAQIEAFVPKQLDGRAFGTMCLSEPQAGSSLADVRTRAVAEGQDDLGARYRLTGNKMWISGGDQNISETIHHLVLAKIPDADGTLPDGTRGLSLFLVPKHLPGGERNDVAVAGLNHKMGYRGTSNCLLNFGEGTRFRPGGQAGAIGWLVGKPGQGLAIMFHMMNEARLGVGLGAAAIAMRAHMLSVDYARTRLQGRTDPAGAPVAIAAHADVARMLTRQKAIAEAALSIILFCARLVDDRDTAETPEARAQADRLLGLLTPAAKTWTAEWGLEVNSIAIQIHGGYGYTRDFDVEQLYRDQRLNPIHEGTTGIQGIDFVGRKLLKEGGAGLDMLAERIARTIDRAGQAELTEEAQGLSAAWARFLDVRQALPAIPREHWMTFATDLLDGFGTTLAAWMLLDQALVAGTEDRRTLARFFIAYDLPRAHRAFDLALRKPVPLLDFTGDAQ
ncbi:MAG: acyl-CoA dehydrogenase [Rhodobacteraceae bacterium]|nr:acyl-CoA dehydrogenase [Paracoccaceae bacterium]